MCFSTHKKTHEFFLSLSFSPVTTDAGDFATSKLAPAPTPAPLELTTVRWSRRTRSTQNNWLPGFHHGTTGIIHQRVLDVTRSATGQAHPPTHETTGENHLKSLPIIHEQTQQHPLDHRRAPAPGPAMAVAVAAAADL